MKKIGQREVIAVLIASALLLGVGAAVILKDSTPDWVYYQSEFRDIIAENFGSVDPADIHRGIQQIWVEDLDRVDRCITCHQGILWKGLESIEQPWGTHPNLEWLQIHPVEDYGCTICHGGQGYALGEWDAHGYVKHWDEPLLGELVASDYDPRSPPPLYQSKCNYCHRYERETRGLDYINHAKQLVRIKGCKVCHIINGQGGQMGPNLTFEGDKHAEEFDFSNLVSEQQTVFNWHVMHFKSPPTLIPNSIMPEMNFQTKDALSLAMLTMSWKDNGQLPRAYFPGITLQDEQTPEEIERERIMREGDGAFFVQNSCFVCHSVKAFEIESPTNKGPDLSYAPDDVRARFSKTLEEFIFNPTGTMQIIFESQIVLSDEQKWEAINKIIKAYDIVKNREPDTLVNQ